MSPVTEELFEKYVIPNYRRFPVSIERGEGSWVWDDQGRRYLDFFPGWGCNLLGHCPPAVVEAVQDQVAKLIHVPNTWHIEAQGLWAKLLSERSFGGQAFFCNSGSRGQRSGHQAGPPAHAARAVQDHHVRGRLSRPHARRTTATAQPKYHEGLGPLMAGFRLRAVRRSRRGSATDRRRDGRAFWSNRSRAKGASAFRPRGSLQGLRQLADEHELLLIFDEVQTGCGRTGEWFAYQHFDVTPDVMTLAKSLCGGIAGAAMLTTAEIAPSLRPGMHAATFGGNPIAARAGIATIETIEREGLLDRAKQLGERFRSGWTPLVDELRHRPEVRGYGLDDRHRIDGRRDTGGRRMHGTRAC